MRDFNPFNKVMNEIKSLESSFGGKKYSEGQLKLIIDIADKVPFKVFEEACTSLLGSSRYKPLPLDFRNALKGYHERKRHEELEKDPGYKAKCDFCKDTGFPFLDVSDFEYIVGCCFCDIGREQKKDEPFLPQLEREYIPTLKTFPDKEFIPTIGSSDESKEISTTAIQDKIQWWDDVKEISRNYWKGKK